MKLVCSGCERTECSYLESRACREHTEQAGSDVEEVVVGAGGAGQEEGALPAHVPRHGADRGAQVMRGAGDMIYNLCSVPAPT